MRATFCAVVLCVLSMSSAIAVGDPVESATTTPRARPNVVFILVDDLGWMDVSYHGSKIATPNIDSLATEGVRLERAYAFPICSPTRFALMTGRNPLQYGVDGPMENDASLPKKLTLMPEYFHRAGYATWMVGKWHLGMAQISAMPQSRGFDYYYGHLGGFIDYYTHVYFGGLDWQRHGKSIREPGYSTDLLTDDAIRLLDERDRGKPFFLYLAYNAPHTPLQYPPFPHQAYLNIQNLDRRVFAQITTYLDTAIGKVLATIDRQGLHDNTIIVFMSDNGGNLEGGASNGDLREGKGSAYEGGTRVPAIIMWPRVLNSGSSVTSRLFVQDWLPTLLDAAGIEFDPNSFEGRSAWPVLARGEKAADRGAVIIGVKRSKAVYDGRWKLVREGKRPDQLFDIETDTTERHDLAKQFPAIVGKLAAKLNALPDIPSKGARGPKPETLFRDASGAFDYDIRKPETRKPWAESASGG